MAKRASPKAGKKKGAATVAPEALPPVETPKRGRGRPSSYKPEYCDLVIELGEQGKSRTQIAARIGVLRETLTEWGKAHPDFSVALKIAKEYEQAWWEERGQEGLGMGKDFNATAFIFQMKNRFRADYADVHKLEHDASDTFVEILKRMSSQPVPGLGLAEPEKRQLQ